MTPDEKIREFLDDNSNPVDSFQQPNLTREGLLDLRQRITTHAIKELLAEKHRAEVRPVYTDELLALVERVIRLEDALIRITRDTHTTECVYASPQACNCSRDIALEYLQLV